MTTYDTGRAYRMGGISIESRRNDSLNGIRFDSNRTAPTSANDFILYRRADALYVWSGSTETLLGASGGGAAGTLDTIYDNGRTITVDAGAVILAGTDEDTAVLNITADGDSAGACILIANSGSGNDITGTAGWSITKAGLATFATNSVISGIVKVGSGSAAGEVTSNGAYDLSIMTNSGTNSSKITITDAADGDITFAMNGTGGVVISGTTETNPSLTVSNGDVAIADGSLSVTDDDEAESVTIINNSITTTGAAASSGLVQVESTSLTTGVAVNVELTEDTLNGGFYYGAWDASAVARVFSVGENGAVTITGAGGADSLTITNGDVNLADASITLVDADNAVSLSITNDTATTSDVILFDGSGTFTGTGSSAFVQVVQSGLTTGDAFSITTDAMTTGTALLLDSSGTLVTDGAMLEIIADSATTAAGLVRVSADGLTTGVGALIASTSAALAAGQLLNIDHTASSATLVAKTGQLIDIVANRTNTALAGTVADDYDALSLIRTNIQNGAGGTLTATGSIIYVQNVATQTAGTLTDTVKGIEITMDADGTGDALEITHTATGALCMDINGAATSVDDVNITGTGVKADNTGVLNVTGSGAIAAGGSVLRVTTIGTPAAATSYMVDFDASGQTATNNPDAVHVANNGTGRVLHITTSGAATAAVDIESTEGGTTGPILRLSHQGGSQANDDVIARIQFQGEDDAVADESYGRIDSVVRDVAAANPDSDMLFYVDVAGTETLRLELPYDVAGIQVGTGAATAIIQSAGSYDLTLQTGNATTGNITITDGANGNITLTPDGTGAVDIAGKLLHSETTTSAGAGAVAITGTVHEITTTGTGDAMTLADGTEGQILHIVYAAEGAGADTAILTPTSFNDTTITFTDLGESVTLLFTAAKWYVIGNGGTTIA